MASPPQFSSSCFRCKKDGHWYRDCPENANRSSLSSSESSSLSPEQVPAVQCPCGNGACKILTSHTEKNPDKKFYTCCQDSNRCGFFQWVDEVVGFGAPLCPCGAGVCSLNRDENGCWFFACRIRKGHGACPFFRLANSHVNRKMNKNLRRSTGCFSPHDGNSEGSTKPMQSPRKDSQLSSVISEDQSSCPNYKARQNDSESSLIFKNFKQELLNIFEDGSLADRQKMLTIAETTSAALRSLSMLNISGIYEHDNMDCKPRIATLENSMRESLSFQELESISKDACFEKDARQLITNRKAEYEVVESHFPSLCEEFSCMKKGLQNLQEELERFEAKTLEFKTSLLKIECEMSVSKRSTEVGGQEMNEGISMEKEKKGLQHEAKTTLECAEAELSSESCVSVNSPLIAPVKNAKSAACYVYILVITVIVCYTAFVRN